MRVVDETVLVRVPATSANLGPGFDALGLALTLHDEVRARPIAGASQVVVTGQGARDLPMDDSHLIVRAAHAAFEYAGAPRVGLQLQCVNRIPHGRGLGSSAAATVAGVLIARGLISEPDVLDDAVALALATQFEGHPDNAAPALLGGATVAWVDENGPGAANLSLRPEIIPVIAIPRAVASTARARAVLPTTVSLQDAAFNAGRSALLVHSLSEDPSLLFEATEDRLHEQYRRSLIPESIELVERLRMAGFAAVLSGAGPSVAIFTTDGGVGLPELIGADWQVARANVAKVGAQVGRI